jgi:hypothetical protein
MLLFLLACTSEPLPPPPSDAADSGAIEGDGEDSAPPSDGGGAEDTGGGAADSGEDSAPPDSAAPEDDDDPYLYEEDEPEPALSMAELEEAMDAALETALLIDPVDFHEVYEGLRQQGDSSCPYYYTDYLTAYGQYYWRDACTAGSGVEFSGYGISYLTTDFSESGNDYEYRAYFSGAASLVDGAGRALDASGYSSAYHYTVPSNGAEVFYNRLWGEFNWEGDQDGTWLSRGIGMDLYVYGARYPSYSPVGYYTYLDGSLSSIEGPANAARFNTVLIYSESLGSTCAIEPSGTIALRGEDGDWYDIEFQGPSYWGAESFPADCDGCGQVFFRGEEIGEVCPDFGRIQAWGDSPW